MGTHHEHSSRSLLIRIALLLIFIFPGLNGETRTGASAHHVEVQGPALEALEAFEHAAKQARRNSRVLYAGCALEDRA